MTRLRRLAGLRGREGEVDGDGDVVAQVGPVGVVADGDGLDAGGPGAGKEDVVDVVAAILAVPEIVSGASLVALRLGKEMVIGAEEAALLEKTDDGGVIVGFAMVVPNFVAVEVAAEDDGFGGRGSRGRRRRGFRKIEIRRSKIGKRRAANQAIYPANPVGWRRVGVHRIDSVQPRWDETGR